MVQRIQLMLLLVAVMVMGAASHRPLEKEADFRPQRSLLNVRDVSAETTEHQRILAELEQVHQLRERMLQEGMTACGANG